MLLKYYVFMYMIDCTLAIAARFLLFFLKIAKVPKHSQFNVFHSFLDYSSSIKGGYKAD